MNRYRWLILTAGTLASTSLSAVQIGISAIAPAIIESCPTRLFLPNERALEPQIAAMYRRFGLNERQLEILARATPKRDYYCQSAEEVRAYFKAGPLQAGDLVLMHDNRPHPPTFCVHDARYAKTPYCCDFAFVSEDLVARVRSIRVDAATQDSDHQPVLLELDDF